MGYDSDAPANQLGGQEKIWVTVEYGLPQVWVRTESTVIWRGTPLRRASPQMSTKAMLHRTSEVEAPGFLRRLLNVSIPSQVY